MRAVILAGGQGTRLRPLTLNTPKPVVPFANRPFLLCQLELLKAAGVTDITLSLNYQPDRIEEVIGDGSDFGLHIAYVTEPMPLGTGGAYRYASGDRRDRTVVFNGDILTDVDLAAFIARHDAACAVASIALTRVENPSAYGLVETDADGLVRRFLEKPTPETLATLQVNTINAGIYVLEPEILDTIPFGENRSFEYDVFPAVLERRERFSSYILDGRYWRDIGNTQSYLEAHHDLLAGRIKNFAPQTQANYGAATDASIDRTSIIGEGCRIGAGATIRNCVLGPSVVVGENAVVDGSVVWAGVRIGQDADVRDSVLGRGCTIGRGAIVRAGSVLGDATAITDFSKV